MRGRDPLATILGDPLGLIGCSRILWIAISNPEIASSIFSHFEENIDIMIEQWLRCPSCGKGAEELEWRITSEHFEISCNFCESEMKENIEEEIHRLPMR